MQQISTRLLFQHRLTTLCFLAIWENNIDQSFLFYQLMLMICHFLACFPGDMWAIMSQSWSWVRTKLGFLSHVYAGNICQSWQKRLSWKKLERNFLFDIFSCIWSLFHGKTFPIYVLNLKLQKTFKDSAGATRFRNHMTKYTWSIISSIAAICKLQAVVLCTYEDTGISFNKQSATYPSTIYNN